MHDELGALPDPVTVRLDPTPMELHEAPHDGQTDPEPAGRSLEPALGLHEDVEDARQQLRRDPDAVVAHAHHGLGAVALRGELDAPATLRVLRRVGEKVDDHLLETCRVAIDTDLVGR